MTSAGKGGAVRRGPNIIGVCLVAMAQSDVSHDARAVGRYWARGRGWAWVEPISLALRQCEVDAVAGEGYLCVLALRAGVRLPHDGGCAACVERANRASWLLREDGAS